MAPPFLAVTLDAKRRIARAAKSLSLDVGPFGWGYLELLEHVWERKDPRVSALVLSACFGPDSRVPAALVEFGFLVVVGEGAWELAEEESDRLLLTHKQRVAAGKARSEAAGRSAGGTFQRSTSESPAAHQRGTSGEPALTPSTQHPAPSIVELPLAGEPPPAAGKAEVENTAARDLREAWNELTPPVLARWRESAGRNKVALEALKRRPLEQWREVFARIGRCPRLHVGIGEAGWKANPDWAIRKPGVKAEPAQQVLEGAWDGPVSAQTGQRRPNGAGPNQGILTQERVETAEEVEEANRRAEEWVNGG